MTFTKLHCSFQPILNSLLSKIFPQIYLCVRCSMNKGKTIPVKILKKICAALITKKSYTKVMESYKIAKSSLQKYKKLLSLSNVTTVRDILLMDDQKFASIIYGKNAQVYVKAKQAHIRLNRNVRKKYDDSYYLPDYPNYMQQYVDDHDLCKSDLFNDYKEKAIARNKKYIQYSTFLSYLNQYIDKIAGQDIYLHREHLYGYELELDWCGQKIALLDEEGKTLNCSVLVLTWAASYFSFACFVKDQSTKETVEAISKGFEFFGCLPKQLIVDNAKCIVKKHSFGHEAIVNTNFEYFLAKCNVLINVNSPYRPNEKSAVEHCVHLLQQRVLPHIQENITIENANDLLVHLLMEKINDAAFRGNKSKTRQYYFCQFEKRKANVLTGDLPKYAERFENIIVPKNYHIKIKDNYYSVPFAKVRKIVNATVCSGIVNISLGDMLIARHKELIGFNLYSTDKSHCPTHHQAVITQIDKFTNTNDLILYAKTFNSEILAFCLTMTYAKKSFYELKKACLYIIKLYTKAQTDNARTLLITAISNVLKREYPWDVNTYLVDNELKMLTVFDKNNE